MPALPNPRPHLFLIPIAALLAVLPLTVHGPSCGHDFDFHILSWFEAAQQLLHAHFPQWAFTPAYNAGEPRFVFYPPLSWLLGALLGLIMPWTWTPIVYTWLALTASGLTLHRLASRYASPTAGTLAATLYLLNPYMLFTAYERTAYAELLAAAWIPLLLAAILAPEVSILRIALPVALLWLTNAPAAVMSCYTLAFLALARLSTPSFAGLIGKGRGALSSPTAKLAGIITAGTLFGLALPAFYLLPAAYERRDVEVSLAMVPGMRIVDNTLFHRTGDGAHDDVLHTASILAILLLSATAIALYCAFQTTKSGTPDNKSAFRTSESSSRTNKSAAQPSKNACHPERSEGPLYFSDGAYQPIERYPSGPLYFSNGAAQPVDRYSVLFPLTLLTLTIAILLTPISLPLWTHAPELAFLQFPWRILAILTCILCLVAALALTRVTLKPIPLTLAVLAIAAICITPAYRAFHQECDTPDTVSARLDLFHSPTGSDPTDEYTPQTADNDSLQHADPPYWLTPPQSPNAQPDQSHPGPAPHHLTLNPPTPQTLILNLRNYPSWRITRNNSRIDAIDRPDGLIAIPLPAGPSTIDIAESRPPDRIAGDLLSAISALLALTLLRRRSGSIA